METITGSSLSPIGSGRREVGEFFLTPQREIFIAKFHSGGEVPEWDGVFVVTGWLEKWWHLDCAFGPVVQQYTDWPHVGDAIHEVMTFAVGNKKHPEGDFRGWYQCVFGQWHRNHFFREGGPERRPYRESLQCLLSFLTYEHPIG